MTNPLATADFFAFEAGECLDRLELAGPPGRRPACGRLPSRQPGAPGLGADGHASRRSRARPAGWSPWPGRCGKAGATWDPAMPGAGGAGDRGVPSPGASGARMGRRRTRCAPRRLADSARTLAGRPVAEPGEQRGERGEINTGVRAFVGREGALIASALDRAARVAPGRARRPRAPLYRASVACSRSAGWPS